VLSPCVLRMLRPHATLTSSGTAIADVETAERLTVCPPSSSIAARRTSTSPQCFGRMCACTRLRSYERRAPLSPFACGTCETTTDAFWLGAGKCSKPALAGAALAWLNRRHEVCATPRRVTR
jgi:hypothetical protein